MLEELTVEEAIKISTIDCEGPLQGLRGGVTGPQARRGAEVKVVRKVS